MRDITLKRISRAISLLFAIACVAKFAGPQILRFYVESGIGNCRKLPVLCILPEKETVNLAENRKYLANLEQYIFPDIKISAPKEFTVIKERIAKAYYKKTKQPYSHNIIYLFYEKPDFFVNLFPQIKKRGIKSDEVFISRTMSAQLNEIKNITDTFFVIMKSIFAAGMGEQKNIRIVKFTATEIKGFLTYNFDASGNYFDANAFNRTGDFFKIYIIDRSKTLNLSKALAIISTVRKTL
jgi:hypothetical protein